MFPAEGSGKGGPLSPCLGLGKDRTKDNVRGRRRWCMKALLSLKGGGGLYSILFARLKKKYFERERDRQTDRQRETETDRDRERECKRASAEALERRGAADTGVGSVGARRGLRVPPLLAQGPRASVSLGSNLSASSPD